MEAVGPDDDVGAQLVLGAPVPVADPRRVGVDVLHRQHLGVEQQRFALLEAQRDEVLGDLGLRPDHDVAPGQLLHVDADAAPAEAQLEPVVGQPERVHALGRADLAQDVDGAVLEDAGPLAGLDAVARAGLEDHRVDPPGPQQVREQQPRRAAADDGDLGPVGAHAPLPIRSRKTVSPGPCIRTSKRYPGPVTDPSGTASSVARRSSSSDASSGSAALASELLGK